MPLTGTDLLAKVRELGDVSKSDLVRAAGYVSGKKDGSERLNFTAFYEALLEAKGVSLGKDGGGAKAKAGRSLSYLTKIQFNGNLLVGKAYTAMLDLKPGDEFEIKLGRRQIRLVPAGDGDEPAPPLNAAAAAAVTRTPTAPRTRAKATKPPASAAKTRATAPKQPAAKKPAPKKPAPKKPAAAKSPARRKAAP